jgi:peptidoglycan hydrolase CwlO-like protein
MIRLYLLLFIVATFGTVVYSAYAYYNSTQATIAQLRENNTKLEMVAETMQNTISTMEADAERNAKLNKELTAALQKAESNLNRLRKRFSEIDINREAIANPANLEGRINRAVDRLREELKNETTTIIDPAPVAPVSE